MTVSTSDVWLCVDMITQTKNKKNKIEGGECVRVLSDKKAEVVRHDEQWDKICQYILSYLKKAEAKQFLHILLKHNKLNTNRLLGATFDFSTNHYSTTTLKHSNQSFFQMKSLISNKKRLSEKKKIIKLLQWKETFIKHFFISCQKSYKYYTDASLDI